MLPTLPAGADASVTVGTRAEAWYRTLPVPPPAGSPVALPEVAPPSSYAAGTLHVSVTGGNEETRTYFTLDLSKLPLGKNVTGGTAALPLASDTQAGSILPETARLQLCLAPGVVTDGADGAINGALPANCAQSSKGVYTAAVNGQPAAFRFDLAPFAIALTTGASAFAVVPDLSGEATSSAAWHVAFSRRDRQAEGAAPITASLQLGTASDRSSPPDVFEPTIGGPTTDEPMAPLPGLTAGGLANPPTLAPMTPPVQSPTTAPSPATARRSTTQAAYLVDDPFSQPMTFLVPLLLLAGFPFLSKVLLRDLIREQD